MNVLLENLKFKKNVSVSKELIINVLHLRVAVNHAIRVACILFDVADFFLIERQIHW